MNNTPDRFDRTNKLLEASQSIAKVGGWELDLVTNELYWTAETYRIHDTTPEEFNPTLNAGVDCYLPESRQIILEALKSATEKGEGYDLELELKTTKGRDIHVRTTAEVTLENGKPVKLTGAFQDITDLKTAEKQLNNALEKAAESESFLKNIVNEIGDGLFVQDDQSRFLLVNEAFCDLFGLSKNDILGKTLSEYISPIEHERFLLSDQQIISTGQEIISEDQITLRSEIVKIFSTRKKRYIDSKGKKFLIGIIRDITSKKIDEEKLRLSNQLLEASQSIAHVGGWELDLGTNELFWTAETYRIHETTPEEFNPTLNAGVDCYLPESRQLVLDAIKEAKEKGKGYDLELELITTKGRKIHVRTTGVVSFDNGKPIKLTGAFQDITDRKIYQEKLKESEANVSSILNSLTSSVCVIDETGKILKVNDAWNDFGIRNGHNRIVESYADYNYFDVCNSDFENADAKSVYYGLQAVLKGEIDSFDHEYPCHSPEKQQWFLMRANLMNTKEKQIVISHIDISERKNLEKNEKKLFQQSQLAIKTAKLGFWTKDLSSDHINWNDELLEIYGLTREEWLEDLEGWQKQLHPEDASYANEQLTKIFEGSSVFGIEFRIVKKDGEIRYINAAGVPVYNEKNEFVQAIGINRDITELKRAQEELKQSEDKFQSAFNNTLVPTSIINLKTGERIAVNKAFCETFGYSKSELLDGNIHLQNLMEDQQEIQVLMAKVLKEGSLHNHPARMLTKSGELRNMLFNGTKLYPNNDYIYIVSLMDITTQTQQEKALKQSETHLKKVQQIAKVGSWYVDVENNKATWTDELYKIHELDPSQPVPFYTANKKWFTNESWQLLSEALEKTGKDGTPYELELNIVRKDKSIGWLWAKGEALKNEKGEIYALWGANQDITIQKQNFLELETEKMISEILLDYSTSGIYIYDLELGRNRYVNHQYEVILGYTKDEMSTFSPLEFMNLFHPEDRDQVSKHMALVVSGNKDVHLEYRFKKKDGNYVYCRSRDSAFEFTKEGTAKSFIGSFVEITEFKQLESARNEAVNANKLKDEFLANMSHEIRTPLNAIIGFSRLLGDNLDVQDKVVYLDQIQNNSEQLLSLVNDLLNITKIESGKLELKNKTVSLSKLVQSVFNQHVHFIETHHTNLKFKLTVPESGNDFYLVDEVKLKEILHNLIDNAIKFTKKGTVELGCICEEKELKFFVKDDGIGISPNNQKKLFNRFSQVEGISEDYGGTGLGLAICKGLLDKMGGRIWVESTINKGSTFLFTIPKLSTGHLHDEPETVSEVAQSSRPIKKVLIADDSSSVRFFYKTIMKKHGIDCFIAKNGEEAIVYYQQNMDEIDLVLMDIRMPGIGGIEAMKRIKKINPEIHVIAQTAFAMDTELERFLNEGFDNCLTKPIPEDELLKLIHQNKITNERT